MQFILKGEEEDQFLKDSAQDLKNRRNKNRVGLLVSNYSLDAIRDFFSRGRSAAVVDTMVMEAREGGDKFSL